MTRLGRLEHADDTRISGWAFDSDQPSCLIDILLDGRLLVTVRAQDPRPDVQRTHGHLHAGFTFAIAPRLAELTPRESEVTARFQDGEPLARAGDLRIGRHPVDVFARLARGWRVSVKSGDVYWPIGNNATWSQSVGRTYPHAREIFHSELGRELFVAYGTLLGLYRDHAFLRHDDDLDLAFLAQGNDLKDVADEFLRVAAHLRDLGLGVAVLDQGNLHLDIPGYPPRLDVFVHSLLPGRLIGSQVVAELDRSSFEPAAELEVGGTVFAIPQETDAVLSAIYGEWQVPDPYFQWRLSDDKRRVLSGFQRVIAERRPKFGF